MSREAFRVVTLNQEGPRRWSVSGRAYSDISLNDHLTTFSTGGQSLRVVAIVTYGKSTDLLSETMTGTLMLEGELHLGKVAPEFLYSVQE